MNDDFDNSRDDKAILAQLQPRTTQEIAEELVRTWARQYRGTFSPNLVDAITVALDAERAETERVREERQAERNAHNKQQARFGRAIRNAIEEYQARLTQQKAAHEKKGEQWRALVQQRDEARADGVEFAKRYSRLAIDADHLREQLTEAQAALAQMRAACVAEGHGDPRQCPMREDAEDELGPCRICAVLTAGEE